MHKQDPRLWQKLGIRSIKSWYSILHLNELVATCNLVATTIHLQRSVCFQPNIQEQFQFYFPLTSIVTSRKAQIKRKSIKQVWISTENPFSKTIGKKKNTDSNRILSLRKNVTCRDMILSNRWTRTKPPQDLMIRLLRLIHRSCCSPSVCALPRWDRCKDRNRSLWNHPVDRAGSGEYCSVRVVRGES